MTTRITTTSLQIGILLQNDSFQLHGDPVLNARIFHVAENIASYYGVTGDSLHEPLHLDLPIMTTFGNIYINDLRMALEGLIVLKENTEIRLGRRAAQAVANLFAKVLFQEGVYNYLLLGRQLNYAAFYSVLGASICGLGYVIPDYLPGCERIDQEVTI